MASRAIVVSIVLVAAACFFACGTSRDATLAAELAASCSINSDCETPLVCVFATCHVQCETTGADCTPRKLGLCIESDKPYKVCQNPDEEDCTHNSDCPGTEVCAVDDHCRDACTTAKDCAGDEACVSGVCAESAELVDGGLTVADGGLVGQRCAYSSACPGSLVCILGECTVECVTDKDCVLGVACVGGRCGGTAVPDGSVEGGTGKACALDGECQDGVFCNGFEVCAGGHCAAGEPPCNDHSACTADSCAEATATCTHLTGGGPSVDADGDGHAAIGCDTGDDCDDSDAHNFPGNAEVCDFRDNNCNGLVDENLWHQTNGTMGASLPSPVPPSGYSGGATGVPAVLPLASGGYAVMSPVEFTEPIEDGPTYGEDTFDAWLVGTNQMSTAGPIAIAPTASGMFDVDGGCGCVHATLENAAIATDGAGTFAFGAEEDASCSASCTGTFYNPRAVGGVTGANLAMPTTFTFANPTNAQEAAGAAVPVWLAGLHKFAFVWRGEQMGQVGPTYVQTTTITTTAQPATVDGAHLLFASDATSATTMLTAAQATSSAAAAVRVATNGSSIFIGWASPTGKLRYSLFDTTLTPKGMPVDLAEAEDVSFVDVLADGDSFVLLTQDAMMKDARIRYVDATTGAAGVSAPIPGAAGGVTLHLAAQGTGFALVESDTVNGGYRIGFAPGSLATPENTSVAPPTGAQDGPFSFSDFTLMPAASGEVKIVAVDPLHYEVFSAGASLSQLSCGP